MLTPCIIPISQPGTVPPNSQRVSGMSFTDNSILIFIQVAVTVALVSHNIEVCSESRSLQILHNIVNSDDSDDDDGNDHDCNGSGGGGGTATLVISLLPTVKHSLQISKYCIVYSMLQARDSEMRGKVRGRDWHTYPSSVCMASIVADINNMSCCSTDRHF